MAMKVYGVGASPFVQRVLMAARLKGHELPTEMPAGGDMKSPEFRAISPLGRIPAFEEDGWTLAESGAIVTYLDATLDGPPLSPADPKERAHARQIEDLTSFELWGMRPVMICKVFGAMDSPPLVDAGLAQVGGGLAALEAARNPAHHYAAGDTATTADCLLLPLLTLLEIADPAADTLRLLAPHRNLSDYRARMEDDPIVGRSAREMREGFAAIRARRAAAAPAT